MQAKPEKLLQLLEARGVSPTRQRMEIAGILLDKPKHLSADQILAMLRSTGSKVSKATVYNTLNLFARNGLVRTINVEGDRTYYDSNTSHHAHFFNVDSGEIIDIDALSFSDLPKPPAGTKIEEVDVVVRVRGDGKQD